MGDPDKTLDELRAAWPLDWEWHSDDLYLARQGAFKVRVIRLSGVVWATASHKGRTVVPYSMSAASFSQAAVALRAALPEVLAREAARLRDEAAGLDAVRAELMGKVAP